MAAGNVDGIERITAACEAAITALPRGQRGVEAATFWLRALPDACRQGLGDVTDSAPALFRILLAAGILPSLPSHSAMTAAIRLIASVSPLVTQRSARTWTAWFGSSCDPESTITATLRASVTPTMIATLRSRPSPAPRRIGSIRRARDQLTADLQAARDELERERGQAAERCNALIAEHDGLTIKLAKATQERDYFRQLENEHRKKNAPLVAEHERLAAELHAATDRHRTELAAREREQGKTAAALAEAQEALTRRQRELQEAKRRASEANERVRTQGEQIEFLKRQNDDYAGSLADLNKSLTQTRADLEDHQAEHQEAERRAFEQIEALKRERENLAKTLTQTRAELGARQADLTRERTDHAITRQTLAAKDQESLKSSAEILRLKALADAAEGASKGLVQICEWVEIDPGKHSGHEELTEAIATALYHQQISHQKLLNRFEKRLRRRVRALFASECAVRHIKNTHPERHSEALVFVDRHIAEIYEQADALVREDMEKLTAAAAPSS
jgi:DNA repair exonuclease SbcCD ATPase subunit